MVFSSEVKLNLQVGYQTEKTCNCVTKPRLTFNYILELRYDFHDR